jgi:hypothetical protein
LQVLAHNETAQRLYQRFGYSETAGYHYRVQGVRPNGEGGVVSD